jgi:fructose/tagatose bisphosphate aldolase
MIKNRVSQRVFLVLHGGSGIQKKEIKKAIENGIVKININTETRIAWRAGLEKALKKIKEVTPYKILSIPEKEVERVVKEKIILFLNK